jgi:sigma-B regulation protein RsbU (phosphoserine phosphatase)
LLSAGQARGIKEGIIMKSLRTRFLLSFMGISLAASLSIGLIMYFQYSAYIKKSYFDALYNVTAMLEKQYPHLSDTDYLEREGSALSDEYWNLIKQLRVTVESFNITYLYVLARDNGKYRYLIDSDTYQYEGPETMRKFLNKSFEVKDFGLELENAYQNKSFEVTKKPVKTEWGMLVSAFRPVLRNGEVSVIIGADYDMTLTRRMERNAKIGLLLTVPVTLAVLLFSMLLSSSITRPLTDLAAKARKIGGGDLDTLIKISGNDEIAELGNAFNKMTRDLKDYIINIEKITAEKQRINSELSIAAEIQNNMLPAIFPKYSNNEYFSIYAKMTPAKEVGGDFYDFFILDEGETKIALVIADVSGKGVPASLFMVIAKTLIKQQMLQTGDPAGTLASVNKLICEDNARSMFVTALICSIDLASGEMIYANGGHNPPLIALAQGPYQFMELKKGVPPGMLETSRYKQCSMKLKPGDKLYLYTDGVNEAMNTKNEQWGNGRFIETANKNIDLEVEAFDGAIRGSLAGFTSGAEPSDDITTLAFHYIKRIER